MVLIQSNFQYIIIFLLISMVLSLVLSGISILLARRLNLIDYPNSESHKKHTIPTPIAGGIAFLGTLILGVRITGLYNEINIWKILLAGMPIFIFGLWDDFKNIPPRHKLTGQLLSAGLLILIGTRIRIFESPEFFIHGQGNLYILLDQLITVFWVVGIVNSFNFVDSMDGLAVGLGSIVAAFFVLLSFEAQQPILSQFSAIIMGTCIGLYFFNSPPARLFLGDSGAQLLGFIIAAIAISYTPQNASQSSSWLAPILLLGIPIFDTSLVIFSRFRRKVPIYEPRLDHTYHRLLHLGVSPNRSVLGMQMISLLLGFLAFIVLNIPPIFANLILLIILLVSGTILIFLDKKTFWV